MTDDSRRSKYVHAHAVSDVLESVSNVPDLVTRTLLSVRRGKPGLFDELALPGHFRV